MIMDAKLLFSEAQVLTNTDATSTNVLNLANIAEVGEGTQLFVNLILDTAFSSAADVISCNLVTSTGEAVTSTDKLLTILPATATSALQTLGEVAKVPVPSKGVEQYLALSFLVPVAVEDGKFTAFLTLE